MVPIARIFKDNGFADTLTGQSQTCLASCIIYLLF